MRHIMFVLFVVVFSACSSSTSLQQDVGGAVVTESRADVSGCQFIAKVTASVDLSEFDDDREAAMAELFDRLRNSALHKRCDTVYLITVEESMTRLTAVAEGYACESRALSDGPTGGSMP